MWPSDELSANAKGGTELMKTQLWNRLAPELRESVNVICSRVRSLSNTKPNILWCHDLPEDPENMVLKNHHIVDKIAKIVFVSQWQMEGYLKRFPELPVEKCVVIRNAIEPIASKKRTTDKIKMIYHTTPHRGLMILIPVFEFLYDYVRQDITLDVYSSFSIYGWQDRDKPYQELFQRCREHPAITYHGYQSNEVVRDALSESHVFVYPSIWKETSCIAAIEALSAGCDIVYPSYGALPETIQHHGRVYPHIASYEEHMLKFYSVMTEYLSDADYHNYFQVMAAMRSEYVMKRFNWSDRINEWTDLVNSVI